MRQSVTSSLLAALLTFLPAYQARAQPPELAGLMGLTLGVALNNIADRVDSSIEKAGTVVNGVLIRAGSEVWAEIENMRVSAKDVLGKAVKDLDATLTKQLAQISSDANALERKTAQDAQKVLQLAQGVVNTVPWSKTQPQLTSLSPSYGVFDPTFPQKDLMLTIRGNFFDSALPGFAPYLTLDRKRVEPVEVTTSHIIFALPTKLFAAKSGGVFRLLKLPISVPYKETEYIVFSSKQEARFVIGLIGLPPSPGQIVVTTQSSTDVRNRYVVSTPQDNIQSDRDDHDEDRCGPNEPNTIDPSTVALRIDRSEGSTWTEHAVRRNNPSVCWHFRTEHHGLGTSDKVWFHFDYYVTHVGAVIQTDTQAYTMKWGDSKVISGSPGTVTISFKGFDGSSQEYKSGNHDNRFIDISAEGGGFRIAIRQLEDILPIN